MTSPSHLCFAFVNGIILASLSSSIGESPFGWNAQTVANIIALGLGGLVPDMDSPHSVISRVFPPSRLVYQRWGHRTLLHSLLGLGIASVTLYLLLAIIRSLIPLSIGVSSVAYFATGYGSHLIADTLTVRGVPLLYPYPISFAYPSIEYYRLRTGNRKHELVFSGVCLIAVLIYLPVLRRGGAEASLHYAMASVNAAYEDYRSLVGQEGMLDFKGYYTLSKKPVEGRGLILEAYPENFFIFFRGAVLQIGETSGQIISTAARCLPAGHPVTTTTLTVNHEPWSAVLNQIPTSVLVSGELTTNHPFILTRPDLATAGGVSASSQILKLDYAQPHELAGLHLAPRTNAEKLAAEIQALKSSLLKLHQALADSIAARNQNQDPYRRDNLFASVSELRKKKAQLGNQLERAQRDLQATQNIRVFFSGQLLLRAVFVD